MAETLVQVQPTDANRLSALHDELGALLEGDGTAYVVGPDDKRVELPASLGQALKLIVDALAGGEPVTLVSNETVLTTQQAADIIFCSRPHLIKLLDQGEIPFHRVGTHRRIRVEDALAYRERRDAERDAALSELTRLSEELPGGYQ